MLIRSAYLTKIVSLHTQLFVYIFVFKYFKGFVMLRKICVFTAFCALMTTVGVDVAKAQNEVAAWPSTASKGLAYSGVVRMGDLVVVGGVLGQSPETGEVVAGGVLEEGRQAFAHIESMLRLAGATLEDVGVCRVLVDDINGFAALNTVFKEVFPANPPTRSTAIVPEIPHGASIEVECTAYAPN